MKRKVRVTGPGVKLNNVKMVAVCTLLSLLSLIRYCCFLSVTFPFTSPVTLARNLPFPDIKERLIFLCAHAPISAGLAPVYPNVTIACRLCKGILPISFWSSRTTTFSPSSDRYLLPVVTYNVFNNLFILVPHLQ